LRFRRFLAAKSEAGTISGDFLVIFCILNDNILFSKPEICEIIYLLQETGAGFQLKYPGYPEECDVGRLFKVSDFPAGRGTFPIERDRDNRTT
jgi:hypothetical protein